MKISVLIADKFPEVYIEELKKMGLEVIYDPKLGENDIPSIIKNVDILVVRSTKVNASTINNSNRLNLIIRAGAGVNNIDLAAASQKGIYVSNCPGMNSIAVAELAIGLMLSLDRRIPDNVMDFRKSVWNKNEYSKAQGIFGKTLVILGVGNIGMEVAKRANAFGMNVYGMDIYRVEGAPLTYFTDMNEVLPKAEVISIHLPATPETKNMFNKKMFSLLKPGAFVINTSRSDVIDEEAMLEAIKEKNIRVALDVFKGEPEGKSGEVKSPLQDNPNIYVTHHIGASTEQAQNAVAKETVKIIKDYAANGAIDHWVNRARGVDVKYQLVVKHYDRPGVLASILEVIREGNINIEEIENVIFEGGMVGCCSMKMKATLTADMLRVINENPNVISTSLVAL